MTTCVTATYSVADAANAIINVKNRGWYWWIFFTYQNAVGQAKCKVSEGRCRVDFSSTPKLDGDSNYHILSTDYTKYAIVYSCRDAWFGLAREESLWVLSRQNTMSSSDLQTVRNIISAKLPAYSSEKFGELTDHSKCTYE